MAGRMLAAAAHGCFFGFAIVLATASVPPERRGFALSVVVGGIGVANIVGVPLGTAIGNAFGWRATFVMIAAFTLVADAGDRRLRPARHRGARAARRSAPRSGR